jgi:hypothetical protein
VDAGSQQGAVCVSPGPAAAPQRVLAGMAAAEREALLAFLGREESAEDFVKVDPERFNHAVLDFMEEVTAALNLRPCEVQARTGLGHQHQLKLRPQRCPQEAQDMRVSLWTLMLHHLEA